MSADVYGLSEYLKVHDEAAKSFAIERRDHELLMGRMEAKYKSLNQKYQGKSLYSIVFCSLASSD